MSLRHALLGFLALQPMSGYDLRKQMNESVAHFWPADQAQIYRTLAQLASDELVHVREVTQEGRPDRREHSITPAGLTELDTWLTSPVDYAPTRESFLVRLFFVGRLGVRSTRAVLQERADEAREMVAVLEHIQHVNEQALTRMGGEVPLPVRLRLATLANGLIHARAELTWIDDLLHDLDEHDERP